MSLPYCVILWVQIDWTFGRWRSGDASVRLTRHQATVPVVSSRADVSAPSITTSVGNAGWRTRVRDVSCYPWSRTAMGTLCHRCVWWFQLIIASFLYFNQQLVFMMNSVILYIYSYSLEWKLHNLCNLQFTILISSRSGGFFNSCDYVKHCCAQLIKIVKKIDEKVKYYATLVLCNI
jgi:hypothetical protein